MTFSQCLMKGEKNPTECCFGEKKYFHCLSIRISHFLSYAFPSQEAGYLHNSRRPERFFITPSDETAYGKNLTNQYFLLFQYSLFNYLSKITIWHFITMNY